jgi:diphthamide synthase subunit DPH2
VFVPGKHSQPSLLFVGKDRFHPTDAKLRCSNLGLASRFTEKHLTMLERLAKDKHSSLLQKL